jgi:CheY-like chemotaxis protein
MPLFSYSGGPVFPGRIVPPLNIFMSDYVKNIDANDKQRVSVNALLKNGSFRMILADDDADDRDFFAEAMAEVADKIRLDYAEDGVDLLNLLNDEDRLLPHLIFLDLNMPNKSGRECLDAIRENERLKNIPVIIYSTSSSSKDIDETFKKGANLYVRKPSSFTELVSIAQQVLLLDWNKFKPHGSRNNFVFAVKKSN